MQTAIVIVIVAVAAIYMIRRFYNNVQKDKSSTCGCGCDGCSPSQEQSCSELEDQKP